VSTKQSHGLVPRISAGPKTPEAVNVKTGHDGTKVVMIFNKPISNLQLSPQECVQTMAAMKRAYDELMVVINGRA